MTQQHLVVIPVKAPVRDGSFDLYATIVDSVTDGGETLQNGDVLAVSSKYAAISEGRVVSLDTVQVGSQAAYFAQRYMIDPKLAQLVIEESDHIFGGSTCDFSDTQVGFLLTSTYGILSPNAGLDLSNIPKGKVVLFPSSPYRMAREIRARLEVNIGVILTDSWLVPGRLGTSGIALATAGLNPVQDERGKIDLFGNTVQVTVRGVADAICICAQMVMGEAAEATPFAVVRNTGITLVDDAFDVDDVSISWEQCIYVNALANGRLEVPDNIDIS